MIFFLLQPPSLKDEGHPDHLQCFHHRCNRINIISLKVAKKYNFLPEPNTIQHHKRKVKKGKFQSELVKILLCFWQFFFFPGSEMPGNNFSIQGLICSEAQDNCDFLPPLSILNKTSSGTFSSSISHCPTSGSA